MISEVAVRKGVPGDIASLLALEAGFKGDAFSRRQMRYLLTRAKGEVLVAECEGRVAGYLSVLMSARHKTGRIYSIAVDPACRRKGIAGILLDEALAFARKNGTRAVFLEVSVGNFQALALYKKKGFTERALKRGYYRDGTDACGMMLPLV